MKIGLVFCDTLEEDRFKPFESFLEWDSYFDIYANGLQERGHTCTKYIQSEKIREVKEYKHRLGHRLVRIPVGETTKFLIKEDLDILHYSSYYSKLFAESKKIKHIPIIGHWTGGILPKGVKGFLWKKVLAPALKNTKMILLASDSEYEKESLKTNFQIHQTKTIPTQIVDTKIFHPLPSAENPFSIVNLAEGIFPPHNDPWKKNPYLMLDLLRLCVTIEPKIHLTITRFGPGETHLQKYVDKLGLNKFVTILPKQDHRDIPKLFAGASVLFNAIRFWVLNEGSATFEAWASNRPVAGFKRDSTVWTNQLGGFLLDISTPFNMRESASLFIKYLSSKDFMTVKAEEGLELAKSRYDYNLVPQLEAVYKEVKE